MGLTFVSDELDAYSRAVMGVVERLSPSVASVKLRRGSGSAFAITADGFLLPSAHVVGRRRGREGALAGGAGRVGAANAAVAGVGLGLAIPINAATRRIVGALMSEGRVRRAWLGSAGGPRPLPPKLARELGRSAGVEIVDVVPGSPAEQGGLRAEDLIVSLDGAPIGGVDELQRLMIDEVIGRPVRLGVVRNGELRELPLVPVELDS